MEGSDKQLYYLALVLPPPFSEKVREMQFNMRDDYGVKAALKSPPHITVHMPFRLKPKKEGLLQKTIADICHHQSPFYINLQDFNHFDNRVIFIDVKWSEELYRLYKLTSSTMRKAFGLENADYKNRGYNPHVTVAFRDLNQAKFDKIWNAYGDKKYSASFQATGLSLLRHNGRSWDVQHSFQFKSNESD